MDKTLKRQIVITLGNRKQQGRYLNSENHRIVKVTPKNAHKNVGDNKGNKYKSLINKTQ